jgi:exodeoxyribonuclease VII small subunit
MSTKNDQSFAEKFSELESIVEWFEGDAQDIDESLRKFERGAELSKELKKYLEQTENKVTKIKEKFDVA